MTPRSQIKADVSERYVVRNCDEMDEFQACVRLQREVWGFSDLDLIPSRLFVVARKIGGQVVGAFLGDELVGFAMGIPGFRDGKSYLHSHMLAVSPKHRDAGLGQRLKLFQREDAIAGGYDLMEWTFDPLEIKNAYLNIHKLGAISRRYVDNQYGFTSSALQAGLPTDRLSAEWWLKSERVLRLLKTGKLPEMPRRETIDVPAHIYEWKQGTEKERALQVQSENREGLKRAFAQGLTVLDYERDSEGNGLFILGEWEEVSSKEPKDFRR